jgi:cytochrome c-type biogenesis protein CcmH
MRRPAHRWAAAAFLVTSLALLSPVEGAPDRDPAHAITSQLICPCSCGEVLSGCTCDTGKSMQAFVENSLKGGKSKDQIIGALVAQYGEVIRGAPKAKGFNLLVWVAPFAATLAGFVIASIVLRRMVRRRAPALAAAGGASMPGNTGSGSAETEMDALRARAEAELRGLRE